ncbi:MAG: sigma 54-interacting transcriptional regulator [Pseudomonadota bacterium]
MDIKEHWRKIIDSVQDGIILVDEKGRFLAANQTAQLITGYTEKQLIGQSCRILNCTGCAIIGKGKGKDWCGLFTEVFIREKKCLITNSRNQNIPVIKSATVLYDENNQIVGAVETLKDISENINYKNELATIKRLYEVEDGFHGIIGRTPIMQNLYEHIQSVASLDTPVMILGPSGTGKEMVAKALYETGNRASKPFVKINCAALSEHILESELFGHVKGAYTGAETDRIGRFEAAHKGTLFLDEIGDIPLSVQVKLLRVLEEKTIQRVGSNTSIPIDARIITATHKNLEQLIEQGKFREDLFFRINVFPLICPSLSERKDDITLLIQHFVSLHAEKTGKNIFGITPEAMGLMVAYPWPGNIRELRNAVEYAFVLARGKSIGLEHLPEKITGTMGQANKMGTAISSNDTITKGQSEKQALCKALEQADGNQTNAAKILGISRITVWKRINKYGITVK